MSTISGPLIGPEQSFPKRVHMRQRGKVLSHLMRFFRHAEHGLVLAGMSFIDGTERRDERWDEIIPYSRATVK